MKRLLGARRRALSRRRSRRAAAAARAAASPSPRAGSSTRRIGDAIARNGYDSITQRAYVPLAAQAVAGGARDAARFSPAPRRRRSVGPADAALSRLLADVGLPAPRLVGWRHERVSASPASALLAPRRCEHVDVARARLRAQRADRDRRRAAAPTRRARRLRRDPRRRRTVAGLRRLSGARGAARSRSSIARKIGCGHREWNISRAELAPLRRERPVHATPRSTRWSSSSTRRASCAGTAAAPIRCAACSTAWSTPSGCSTRCARAPRPRAPRCSIITRSPATASARAASWCSCTTTNARRRAERRACSSTAWARPARTRAFDLCCPTVGGVLARPRPRATRPIEVDPRSARSWSPPRTSKRAASTSGRASPAPRRTLHHLPLLLRRAAAAAASIRCSRSTSASSPRARATSAATRTLEQADLRLHPRLHAAAAHAGGAARSRAARRRRRRAPLAADLLRLRLDDPLVPAGRRRAARAARATIGSIARSLASVWREPPGAAGDGRPDADDGAGPRRDATDAPPTSIACSTPPSPRWPELGNERLRARSCATRSASATSSRSCAADREAAKVRPGSIDEVRQRCSWRSVATDRRAARTACDPARPSRLRLAILKDGLSRLARGG